MRYLPLFALLLLAACAAPESAEPEAPMTVAMDYAPVETKADSVALAALNASGGADALAALRYLRFNFGFDRNGEVSVGREHLWDRVTGRYRVEWEGGEDSTYVVLFNVNDHEAGQTYLNGQAVAEEDNASLLQRAYSGYINDTYWLLFPAKLLDPGVNRAYIADSSNAERDVITLTFEGVGLTPGDTYWVYVDKASGLVNQWAFRLQNADADSEPRFYKWLDYQALQTPAGPVNLSPRKESPNGTFALLTDALNAPASVEDALFTDPMPRLD
ncbi:MAG: hypothetical protein RhofKO_27150 [Rhodothermales bacterium]